MGEIFPRPRPPVPMPFTGERLTSELSGQTEIEHLHRYLLARQLCRGKDVIDVASGEGYGSALLAQVAASVTGIEIAADAVAHAGTSYRRANLRFLRGDARAMGLANAVADVVVSFETIEHLAEQAAFLSEVRRVLRPGGILIVSTPDQDNYSPADSPANPSHVVELAKEEFAHLLACHFPHVTVLHQRPLLGTAILPSPAVAADAPVLSFEKRGDYLECSTGLPRAQYVVAVASDQPIAAMPPSLYIETSRIGSLRETEAGQMMRAEGEALRTQMQRERAAHEKAIGALGAEKGEAIAGRAEAERTLQAERASVAARIGELQQALDNARAANVAIQRARERAEEAVSTGRQQLAECRERAAQQEARVAELLSSSSWRITAPLRTVFGPLRRR